MLCRAVGIGFRADRWRGFTFMVFSICVLMVWRSWLCTVKGSSSPTAATAATAAAAAHVSMYVTTVTYEPV